MLKYFRESPKALVLQGSGKQQAYCLDSCYLFFIIVLILVFWCIQAEAANPPETNQEVLKNLSSEWSARYQAMKSSADFQRLVRNATKLSLSDSLPRPQLMFLEKNGHQVFYGTENLEAARTIGTNLLWPAPFNLTGAGISEGMLGQWDDYVAHPEHVEFGDGYGGSRISVGDGTSLHGWHATHVAGTMVASGLYGAAKGMAPEAELVSFFYDDDVSEMAQAAADGMVVSNHSYGEVSGWNFGWVDFSGEWEEALAWYGDATVDQMIDYKFGFYNQSSHDFDEIAMNAPYYLILKSA